MKTKKKLLAAFKIWVIIYPSITLLSYGLGPVLGHIPVYQRTLILTLALVPWMVFVAIPLVEKLLKQDK